MDCFFGDEFEGDVSRYELSPVNQSAFIPYSARSPNSRQIEVNNSTNINKRIIQFMKRSCPMRIQPQESESTRCYRRKMSERLRRENERKGYLALHSMLPPSTKNEKKSIMQMAARRIEELKGYKEVLERRKHELELKMEKSNDIRSNSKIELRVANPISGVDYIVEVLKCLNSLGVKTRSIQSSFDHHQLAAVIHFESQMPEAEVRKAVDRRLQDVQWKLQFHFPEYYST